MNHLGHNFHKYLSLIFIFAIFLTLPLTLAVAVLSVMTRTNTQSVAAKTPIVALCSNASTPSFGEKTDKAKTDQAVLNLKATTAQITQSGSEDVINRAKIRKQALVETIYQNPDAALKSILPADQLSNFQIALPGCFEKQAQFEGSLEIRHVDYFKDKLSIEQIHLTTADGKKITLHPANNLHVPIESRTKVKVKGILVDNELLFNGASSIDRAIDAGGGIDVVSQPGNPPVLGNQNTVFLLVNFNNTAQPGFSTANVKNYVNSQLAPYYAQNSYGKISVTGDAFGWYSIPLAKTCDEVTTRQAAIAAADPFVNFTAYTHLVVFAPVSGCGFGGISSLGKNLVNTADGTVSMSVAMIDAPYYSSLHVVGHELGHGFGNGHAHALNCGNTTITIGLVGCSSIEYGDGFDIMGCCAPYHFSAVHKDYMGWFDATTLTAVGASGTYTIFPLETNTAQAKALKIQRGLFDYLYVEYRQPIGFDSGAVGTDLYQGAIIHAAPYSLDSSYLLDTTPPFSSSYFTLRPGATFTDPVTATRITVTAATATALTLNVVAGKSDFTQPTVTITSPANEATVAGQITVTAGATDVSGIQKVEFYNGGAATPFGTDTSFPYQATLDTTHLPNGTANIYARAYDLSGATFGVPNNIGQSPFFTLNVANSDTLPPSVTLTAPVAGATYTSPVTLSAVAGDNVGIYKVEFTEEGCLIVSACVSLTDSSSPYSRQLFLANGTHKVVARAYDFVGNTTSSYAVICVTLCTIVIPTPSPVVTPTPTPQATIPPITDSKPLPCGIYGDVNADGVISEADAMMVLNGYFKIITLTADQNIRADVNKNTYVNVGDATLIRKYLNGSLAKFSVCP